MPEYLFALHDEGDVTQFPIVHKPA